jgi:hypothetical protein
MEESTNYPYRRNDVAVESEWCGEERAINASKKRSSRASATTERLSIIVPLPESSSVWQTNLENNLVREGFSRAEARRMVKIAAS